MFKRIVTMIAVLLWSGLAFAAHPLISDDTGTQGKGKFQLEVNSEFTYDKETADGVTTKVAGGEVAAAFSYGVTDNVDVVLGLPNQWKKVKEDGTVASDEHGISDVSLELKWRFYDRDGLSFAMKPGLTLPTGNENKGLGNGRDSYAFTFITTKEMDPLAFHLNLAYAHSEYKLQEDKEANRRDIWHVSLASEVEAVKNLRVVANIGMERNPDKTSNTHPAFILGGLIYSIFENFDIDFGIKGGLNKPETDYSILAGIAWRF